MKLDNISIDNSLTKFKDGQKLNLKKDNKKDIIFIYGPNATGKSSLSKLFTAANYKKDNNDYKSILNQLNKIGVDSSLDITINYDDNTKTLFKFDDIQNPIKIPTFNSEYIDNKITNQVDFKNNKFKENELGYSIELESKKNYQNKSREVDNLKQEGTSLNALIQNKISEEKEKIRKDTNTKTNNTKYQLYDIENFKNVDESKIPSKEKIEEEKKIHITFLENLKEINEDNIINFKISELDFEDDFIESITKVNKSISFSEDISKIEFAKNYLDRFELNQKTWKLKGVEYIDDEKCPFCESNIADNSIIKAYKTYLNSSISSQENMLNEELKKFNNYLITTNNIDYMIVNIKNMEKIFEEELSDKFINFFSEYKKLLSKIIAIIQEKKNGENLYQDCSSIIIAFNFDDLTNLINLYKEIRKSIDILNAKINNITNERKTRNDYYIENTGFFSAYYCIRDDLKKLNNLREKYKEKNKELEELRKIYENDVKDKNELVKTMNNILDDFSITNYRVDEKFELYLNRKSVSNKVNKYLSDGEKSIIAFALFIAELTWLYKDDEKEMIFIDDPISSVDYPNLYSIHNHINNIISENPNSQIILTSHNSLFLNLFKFNYKKNAIYYKLIEDETEQTIIIDDTDSPNSIYLEKLQNIFNIYKRNKITIKEKLYIHNYCRYVLETLSRFEFPNHKNDSDSSQYYIKKVIEDMGNNATNYNISANDLQCLCNIVNKGSHATTENVHDNEQYEDVHYIKCCKCIITYIKTKYDGQYQLVSNNYTS